MKKEDCNCGKKPIVNKHFGLCHDCNQIRLHGSKWGKQTPHKEKKEKAPARKSLFVDLGKGGGDKIVYHVYSGGYGRIKSLANQNVFIALDEVFYERCFHECENHVCEECGTELNDVFRGDDGKILLRSRYSHIIPKSIAPELRHEIKNINHLCLKDHMEWENGDKKKMKIYNGNRKRLPQYFK